jgi:predicted MFS family arabinose efflux permease
LRNRWGILAILFLARFAMPFQFQSVAAVAPLLSSKFGVNIADIGLLIGLYFTPGVALALPGGAIGKRFGDKRIVLVSLLLMLIGSLAMAWGQSWHWQIAGRLVSGAGGVILNVLMAKMVTDWFAGKEIASAMAILANAWPAGVALSLLILPAIGTSSGVNAVFLSVAILVAIGIVLFGLGYRTAPDAAVAAAKAEPLGRRALGAVVVAGLIWGLFNVGFAMIFSFGPTMLVERGWTITAAGSTISIVLWLAAFGGASGGILSDWSRRPQLIIVLGCMLFAALLIALAQSDLVIPIVIAIGVISAVPSGPILALPAPVLSPATRAIGMGIFYTMYYVVMMLGPPIAGAAAKWTGSAAAALYFGALMLVICPLLLWLFNRVAARARLA